jgi:tetratricopeptide (TPR) repeat protein
MMRRIGYALLSAVLIALVAVFVVRALRVNPHTLPRLDEAPEALVGLSCERGLAAAQQLTKGGALEHARLAYLWLIQQCDESTILPDVLLEAGSLFGHLQRRPAEARAAYEQFLERFPDHPGAADATYHLAKLEIDAGNYAAAAASLTALAERYPDSERRESARFLAEEAAELLAAERQSRRTIGGQLAAMVPNNLASLLAVMLAIGPAVLQTVRQGRRDAAGGTVRWPWLVPVLVITLTLLNNLMNNVDNARRNTLVMEKLDRLLESNAQTPGNK